MFIIALTACTPHKRMARLIKNNPELLSVTDTLKFTDTIHFQTERVYRDSVFLISDARRDTVIVKEKNLTIRTYIKGDTIYSSGECDTVFQTIIKEYSVPYKVVEYKKRSFFERIIIPGVIGFSLMILFIYGGSYIVKKVKSFSRFS